MRWIWVNYKLLEVFAKLFSRVTNARTPGVTILLLCYRVNIYSLRFFSIYSLHFGVKIRKEVEKYERGTEKVERETKEWVKILKCEWHGWKKRRKYMWYVTKNRKTEVCRLKRNRLKRKVCRLKRNERSMILDSKWTYWSNFDP